MGTSTSQMSGSSLGWQTVRRLYESEGSSAARVLRQVWSAVDASDGGSLVDQLRRPVIDRIAAAAAGAASKGEVQATCNRLIREARAASFAAVVGTSGAVAGERFPDVAVLAAFKGEVAGSCLTLAADTPPRCRRMAARSGSRRRPEGRWPSSSRRRDPPANLSLDMSRKAVATFA